MSKLNQIKIPLNLTTETPEQWVVLKFKAGLTDDTIYKVFAGWRGGYLNGDRWKLNSGITKVEEDDDYFYFYGYSGSCYKCHKNGYGLKKEMYSFSSYVQGVLEDIIEIRRLLGNSVDVELMPEETNWKELNKNKDE